MIYVHLDDGFIFESFLCVDNSKENAYTIKQSQRRQIIS